jgi:hypothetical protein
MNAEAVVAIVFVVMFFVGIVVGIIVVIALSAVRRDQRDQRDTLAELARQDKFADIDDTECNCGASGIPGRWEGVIPDGGPHWPVMPEEASNGE